MSANYTFSFVANAWLEKIKYSVSHNTCSIYKGYIQNYMIPHLVVNEREKTIEEVNNNLESYIEKINEAERTELIKKFYPVFSMILDYAVAQGYINFNYSKVIAPIAKDEGLSYADIGIDELAAILAQAKHDDMLIDFILILDLGLSRGEILGLKWGDIDLDTKSLTVNRLVVARGGATVVSDEENKSVIHMTDITAKLLADRRGNAEDFLIPSPSGATTPFNPSAYRKKIDRTIKKALNGESVTIEILGYILSIIKDSSQGSVERDGVLKYALDKSKNYSAVENKYRKAGTGYISQISPNCWQGRYTPTIKGKRISKNVYATTKEECEKKLSEMITSMKETGAC